MGLARSLSLFGAVMLVVGNVVGAGIFTTTGLLAAKIQSPMALLLVWLAGGLLTLCGALTYAELGAMFPRAGGDYQFLKEAYGPLASFLLGWLYFWVINPGSIAALSIALLTYIPGLDFVRGSLHQKAGAGIIVVVLSFISYRSTRLAAWAQSAITIGSIVLLAALPILGPIWGQGSFENFVSAKGEIFSLASIPGSSMIAVIFTYSGWFAAAYVGSEVNRPTRNVPLALLIGTASVTALYIAVNAAYIYAMPLSDMKGTVNVAMLASMRLFGTNISMFVSVAIILSIGSCINGTVMTGARVCYAMADDGLFFKRLKSVHTKYGTPHTAIAIQAMVSLALIALGTFDELLTYVVFAMLLSSMATGAGHILLRLRRPDLPRPYSAPGFPFVQLIFVASYGLIAVSIATANPIASAIGLCLAATGVPFYYIWNKVKKV